MLTRVLIGIVLTLALAMPASAQCTLTTAQCAAFKADILANSDTAAAYTEGNLSLLADLYNAEAAPEFWVWRTSVSRAEIYNDVSPAASVWNWTTYKNQAVAEQNAWVQMFMGDTADFSKQNLRDGVAAIFTGSAQANAQRDHVLAIGRRKATRFEKLFASGTGASATPATMGAVTPTGSRIEGTIRFEMFVGL